MKDGRRFLVKDGDMLSSDGRIALGLVGEAGENVWDIVRCRRGATGKNGRSKDHDLSKSRARGWQPKK